MEVVLSWITGLDKHLVDDLFEDRWILQAVLRATSSLAKQYTMRLAFVTSVMASDEIHGWLHEDGDEETHRLAMAQLCALRLLVRPTGDTVETTSAGDVQGDLKFNPNPQQQLQDSLLRLVSAPQPVTDQSQTALPTEMDLEAYGRIRWENVLRSMIGQGPLTDQWQTRTPTWVPQCLVLEELMEADGFRLTSDGFQFLLDDPPRQLWQLMIGFVRLKNEQREVLSLLCKLSFMVPGLSYQMAELTEFQQGTLKNDLSKCGMVYVPEGGVCFYPTPLGIALSGSIGFSGKQDAAKATVILERNFRVYLHADTRRDIQVPLLSLFARIEYILPNLCAALLTRKSIFTAVTHGIDVEAIIKFLADRAHPCIRNAAGQACLPHNVCKQLRHWAAERDRLTYQECVCIDGFKTVDDFLRAENTARGLGGCLWANQEKLVLVVAEDIAPQVLQGC